MKNEKEDKEDEEDDQFHQIIPEEEYDHFEFPSNLSHAKAHGESLNVKFPVDNEDYNNVHTSGFSQSRKKVPLCVSYKDLIYFNEYLPVHFRLMM